MKDKDEKLLAEAYMGIKNPRSKFDADFAPGRENELMGKPEYALVKIHDEEKVMQYDPDRDTYKDTTGAAYTEPVPVVIRPATEEEITKFKGSQLSYGKSLSDWYDRH